jgi:hypothetical protein
VVATSSPNPADHVQPVRDRSSKLLLTAKQAGKLTLTATGGDPVATSDPKAITVVEPSRARVGLPFVGVGWGSVVVAILILTVTGALGLAGKLGGQSFTTIIVALVGYVVVKGVTDNSAHAAAGTTGAAPTGGTNTSTGGGNT